jgi:hypothetical protein
LAPKAPIDDYSDVARTTSTAVSPPHRAQSIRRHLATREGLDHLTCRLFASISEADPVEDDLFLDILSREGLGSSPEQPLALVAEKASNNGHLDNGWKRAEILPTRGRKKSLNFLNTP